MTGQKKQQKKNRLIFGKDDFFAWELHFFLIFHEFPFNEVWVFFFAVAYQAALQFFKQKSVTYLMT